MCPLQWSDFGRQVFGEEDTLENTREWDGDKWKAVATLGGLLRVTGTPQLARSDSTADWYMRIEIDYNQRKGKDSSLLSNTYDTQLSS